MLDMLSGPPAMCPTAALSGGSSRYVPGLYTASREMRALALSSMVCVYWDTGKSTSSPPKGSLSDTATWGAQGCRLGPSGHKLGT
eukprot:scaffold124909_cov57-Phaeocystis_antarctica.AAC.2